MIDQNFKNHYKYLKDIENKTLQKLENIEMLEKEKQKKKLKKEKERKEKEEKNIRKKKTRKRVTQYPLIKWLVKKSVKGVAKLRSLHLFQFILFPRKELHKEVIKKKKTIARRKWYKRRNKLDNKCICF